MLRVLFFFWWLVAIAPASIAQADAVDDCNQSADSAVRIDGCSTVLRRLGITTEDRAAALTNRGNGYRAMRQLDKALADFNAAIALRPDARSYSNRAALLAIQGDATGAEHDLKQAIILDPTYADAHHNLGMLYARRNDAVRAIEAFSLALAANPKVRNSRLARANILCQAGRADLAREDFLIGLREGSIKATMVLNHLRKRGLLQTQNQFDDAAMVALTRWVAAGCR